MPYREIRRPADEEESAQKPTVRGISWSLDHDLANDGLSSNERIVKIMSRNDSEMLSKWVVAVRNKTGKADIARTVLKEFHSCGATHRQKAEDMVKGMTSFFKRYESFKKKVQEQTKGRIYKYNKNGEIEYDNVSDFLQVYLEKNFPYFLDLTKAFDILYRKKPALAEEDDFYEEDNVSEKGDAASSDNESVVEIRPPPTTTTAEVEEKVKPKRQLSSDAEKKANKLKRMKVEAEIRRFDAETKRIEFETQERILELYIKYNDPKFIGTEESKAAQLIFKNAFPALYSQTPATNPHHSDSEVDELEE